MEGEGPRERKGCPASPSGSRLPDIHLVAGKAPGRNGLSFAMRCPDVVITSCCLNPLSLLCTTDNLNRIWYLEVGCCPNGHLNPVTLAVALGGGVREKQKRPRGDRWWGFEGHGEECYRSLKNRTPFMQRQKVWQRCHL